MPPGTRPLTLHRLGDGTEQAERMFWGYKPSWFIHAKDGAPILMAGIAAWNPDAEMDAAHGFAIVTDDSAGGMVDIHDRRPVLLTPNDAIVWVDPA